MNYISPSIKLFNKDSVDLDSWYKVWIQSRDAVVSRTEEGYLKVGEEVFKNEDEYKDRILRMNLQYNNFPQLSFEVQGSILFRDILFSINKAAQWATSLRFLFSTRDKESGLYDENNYPVSAEYEGVPEWEDQFRKYMEAISKDSRTDHNRLEMPFSISSRYWISMNLKTLISFLSMLRYKMPFFYIVYGNLFVECLKKELNFDISKYITTSVESGIGQYFSRSEFKESYTEIDDIVILKVNMGMVLYSQFLRQADTTVKGLFDELEHTDTNIFIHKVFKGNTPLKVTYIADKEKFYRTVSNRSCNFAMSEGSLGISSWSNVVDQVIKDFTVEQFKEFLPCKFSGKCVECRFYDDVKYRHEGVEKDNIACPIYFKSKELAKQKIERDQNVLSQLYDKVVDTLI